MPVTFKTFDDFADLLPDAPPFDERDESWQTVTRLGEILGISDAGLLRIRRRYHRRYETRIKGNVYIHCPSWLRLWFAEQLERREEITLVDRANGYS